MINRNKLLCNNHIKYLGPILRLYRYDTDSMIVNNYRLCKICEKDLNMHIK